MSDQFFPAFHGCNACFSHLRAQGEIRAAEKAIADLIEKYDYLKITGYENEVAYPANLERLERAKRQAETEQRRFDLHTCENKEEQTQWAKRLRVPRGPM